MQPFHLPRHGVTRLTFDGASGFRGQRELASAVQDGIETVLLADR